MCRTATTYVTCASLTRSFVTCALVLLKGSRLCTCPFTLTCLQSVAVNLSTQCLVPYLAVSATFEFPEDCLFVLLKYLEALILMDVLLGWAGLATV